MNEPASFEKPLNWPLYSLDDNSNQLLKLDCPVNQFDDPPYRTSKKI